LKVDGRVKVISKSGAEGLLKLAGNNISKTDPRALTTLPVLYDVLQYLGWDLPGVVREMKARPSTETLEEGYGILCKRLDELLTNCGAIRERLLAAAGARELRAPKNREGEGHPFMRPVIQKAVARVAGEIVQQGLLPWPEVMSRLSQLDWRLAAPPWIAVFSVDGAKMIPGKENADLLGDLLHVHLAPKNAQAIKRARKTFKDLRGQQYPITEEELAKRVPAVEVTAVPEPVHHRPELSEQVEAELAAIPPEEDDEVSTATAGGEKE
jgi:DNA sulfur modification protein DndB